MKRLIIIWLFVFVTGFASAQSRIYISGGISTSLGGNLATFDATHPAAWSADLEWQKKLAGSVSVVTGISAFNVSYVNDSTTFGSVSKFNAIYVGVPLIARWNFGNKNLFYMDLGFQPYYLVDAHLTESVIRFGDVRTVDADITSYSTRLYASIKFQQVFAFNRVILAIYIVFPFAGQSPVGNLADHWPINLQNSTYLLSNGYSDFFIFGLKTGIRIK